MDFTRELEELQRLHREGALTDADLASAKSALIEGLSGKGKNLAVSSPPRSSAVFLGGVLLVLVGALMMAGATIQLCRNPPPETIAEPIAVGCAAGLLPFLLGCYCCIRNAR